MSVNDPIPVDGIDLNTSFSRQRAVQAITNEVLRPAEHDSLVDMVRSGEAQVRDVGELTYNGRLYIVNHMRKLQSGESIPEASAGHLVDLIDASAARFKEAMQGTTPNIQNNAGWNGAVNLLNFRQRDDYLGASARVLDARVGEISEHSSLDDYLDYSRQFAGKDGMLRNALAMVATQFPADTSWYLAERSLVSEAYQRMRYERAFARAKSGVGTLIGQLGLSEQVRRQAFEKLSLVDFSAFDHLVGGVTEQDQGAMGDYQGGTLRVEVKYEGNPSRAIDRSEDSAFHTLQHEMFHAVSAQGPDASRVGLRVSNGEGRDVNEALTEFLNQLALGSVRKHEDGRVSVANMSGYTLGVAAMALLADQQPEHLGSLVDVYFGGTQDEMTLTSALHAFYDTLDLVDPQSNQV